MNIKIIRQITLAVIGALGLNSDEFSEKRLVSIDQIVYKKLRKSLETLFILEIWCRHYVKFNSVPAYSLMQRALTNAQKTFESLKIETLFLKQKP